MSLTAASEDGAAPPTGLRKVVAASMAGTVVEWYEFFLYASAATLVFNTVFFPAAGNDLDNIIKAFLTYAVGFVARPIGGIVFGHFGDRYGRKHLLQIAIVLVGVATFLMGCLPTFAQVGYAAPILLVTLRFLQGFAVGGEWGGAVLLVAEHSPDSQRGFWASWPQAAVPLGNLLATLVLLILSWTLSDAAFLSWGWRVGFWLSVVIVAIGYYIRTRITDAPIFHEARRELEENKAQANSRHSSGSPTSYGVVEVFRRYPRGVFTAMGLRVAENILYYMVVTFSITYLKIQLHMDTKRILLLLLIAHIVQAIALPIVGRYTDIVGRRAPYALGATLAAGWGFVAFPMFDTRNEWIILVAIVIGLLVHSLMFAGQPAIMAEMFPTRMRYSGVSVGYQVTSIFAGSLAPVIGAALLSRYHSWVPVAIYLAAVAPITLIAVWALPETKGSSLHELDAADRARG
ncbi:MHS family MFS transporter [Mycobacterium sp. CBMA271]|uniref:MFS transporter n=1 Tax=unclassified Mycobacteroides TaxID=2618759 RepID=UPI0012DDD77C|nr:MULTISPECIES: MFS transporter [unclassified Mycobacteroides]MUM19087.1 MFS transporter [Mycobacteroides sp. CBMA 326]MUM21500.1 MHS family MFS transporter [Mycobacteroides sp. CBMA 271]